MVVGGADEKKKPTSSVEIMVQGIWSYVASLPSPRFFFAAANLAGSLSVFGE